MFNRLKLTLRLHLLLNVDGKAIMQLQSVQQSKPIKVSIIIAQYDAAIIDIISFTAEVKKEEKSLQQSVSSKAMLAK